MRFRTTLATALLIVFGAAGIATGLKAGNNQNPATDVQLPITIRQLPPANYIPVELMCGTASVTPPNRLNEFQCILKNNTNKSMTAANIIYSTVLEEAGKETRDTHIHTLTTYIHPDFYKKERNILPGATTSFRPIGVITYDNAVIKGVEVYIDYVEFEDKTNLGPNADGERIINDLRQGAVKYKRWLAQEYKRKSIESVIESLKTPDELLGLGFNNSSQEEGANRYRKQLRKAYDNRGPTEVQKYLSKIEPRIN